MKLYQTLPLIVSFLFIFSFSSAQEAPRDSIGIYEHLDGFMPAGLVFFDEEGDSVELDKYIDKPTVVAFVYYNCPGICSPLMDGIAKVISEAEDLELGKDYQVINISIDPAETPALAKAKKVNYIAQITRDVDESGWTFTTGDSISIYKASTALGFKYKRDGKDFIHAAAIMVLSPEKKITRYLNGVYFPAFEFKMAIVEASEGKSGPTINRLINFCYSYDPEKGYVLNITKITGFIVLTAAMLLFLVLALKKRKKVRR